MKAAQITQYSKNIRMTVNDIPVPEIGDDELLIRVKATAVNPVDILNLTGAIRLYNIYLKISGLSNQAAVFISALLCQIMNGGYRNKLFAENSIQL